MWNSKVRFVEKEINVKIYIDENDIYTDEQILIRLEEVLDDLDVLYSIERSCRSICIIRRRYKNAFGHTVRS